jgi:hypothetical protein
MPPFYYHPHRLPFSVASCLLHARLNGSCKLGAHNPGGLAHLVGEALPSTINTTFSRLLLSGHAEICRMWQCRTYFHYFNSCVATYWFLLVFLKFAGCAKLQDVPNRLAFTKYLSVWWTDRVPHYFLYVVIHSLTCRMCCNRRSTSCRMSCSSLSKSQDI